ncbi:CHAP domain-containing protein [Phytohabitans sp. ZYX-F-186]|uniref:CHAP domain-containing protein n=1 Tax=Phytohabitans maris TaxID=3071409 RepID=A0ABU0Z7T7_9ACTN|nr:CHAP domain-containing protein [Phytohabitans sp. ZYX-F-186]MDQ7903068.1 CHAP domain-containing protein [Phytohabitans sp. ZYX-F-186]
MYTTAEAVDPAPAAAYDANTGDYPWHDATELKASTSDYGYETCPSNASGCMTKKYVKDSKTYGEYDAWNYYFRNCTSYAAWRLNYEFGVNPNGLGNATTWNNNAPGKGWAVDQTPEIGDVAHFEGNDKEPWKAPGHVAFVEEIGAGANAGKVRLAEYNQGLDGKFRSDRWKPVGEISSFIDVNGTNPSDFSLKLPGVGASGGGGNGGASPARIDELAFIRTNHWSGRTEAVIWDGAPDYTTLRAAPQTGYPAISDPENVTPLALDTNGDGIDELAFIRTNHWSGRTEAVIWDGSPHFTTLKAAPQTGYPAITDPENVTPLAIDINGDNVDELAFIRTNHPSGRTEISLWYGAPNYDLHHSTDRTGYPAISDPQNVTPLAMDVNGDGKDELAFVRTNHSSGQTEISIWHGAPHYTTELATSRTGYPAISDPENVTPIAIDINGDKVDELGFVRSNHISGQTELSLWYGTPGFGLHHNTTRTGYPAISDPANVTPLAIDLP